MLTHFTLLPPKCRSVWGARAGVAFRGEYGCQEAGRPPSPPFSLPPQKVLAAPSHCRGPSLSPTPRRPHQVGRPTPAPSAARRSVRERPPGWTSLSSCLPAPTPTLVSAQGRGHALGLLWVRASLLPFHALESLGKFLVQAGFVNVRPVPQDRVAPALSSQSPSGALLASQSCPRQARVAGQVDGALFSARRHSSVDPRQATAELATSCWGLPVARRVAGCERCRGRAGSGGRLQALPGLWVTRPVRTLCGECSRMGLRASRPSGVSSLLSARCAGNSAGRCSVPGRC